MLLLATTCSSHPRAYWSNARIIPQKWSFYFIEVMIKKPEGSYHVGFMLLRNKTQKTWPELARYATVLLSDRTIPHHPVSQSKPALSTKGLILFSMGSKWEHHYKKRIRSCNEASITKKKNQVVQWSLHCKKKESGRVPFTNSKWSSDFTIQNRNGARSSIWTPFHPNHDIPTAPRPFLTAARPPPTTPPHHEAFLFVQCSLSPTSTLTY